MQAKLKFVFAAGLVGAAFVPAVFAADQQVGPIEQVAREAWRQDIAQIATPSEGCFHASYPSIVWQQVACRALTQAAHPLPHYYLFAAQETAGNGNDYTIQTGSHLITSAVGTFPSVTGVTSEQSIGVAAYGDGGILGANEYSVQLNTQFTSTTAACKSHSGCTVWQQWVYATDYEEQGKGAIFMQDWLIGYGSSRCPSGFGSDGEGDCYENSSAALPPDISPTALASLKLTATAAKSGNDTAVVTYDGEAYSTSQKDSTLDIASVWNTGEFNIVGNAGGSEAEFNNGASITVNLAVSDGSTSAPSCVADSGTTGESNNLNLGTCTASSGSTPSIKFTESN
ncbi:hypothetical protein [Dyella caseinilytica]|uniref:Secreted protein n=1 Tax=Dyella caseinilytica TaxID=1849581 RepID=A0ABX7GWH6_9GAMM|nr:hypothetical protein [Dyella caseinilytica]QRN54786.1 hypothetical protein ISN74_05365 [Dyella caseinilytica]GFZ96838.1 hypothetical protein GCM10011408_16600 [Dyella caseinilytica]